jgi:F420-dependent oxidoreductase-like protein
VSGRYAIKTPPQHGTWREFLDVWLAADQMDVFESGWTMDHFYPLTPPIEGTHLESWTMLAALAQATTRLRLGAMVNGMHYRHPAITANMAVTVDHISNGRFVLGLGAGWFLTESDAYGIRLGSMKDRFDRLDEGVQVIRSLLDNEHTTFHGRFYELTDARCEPKPVQEHLPIAIGGKGKQRTLRIVARHADHWDITFPPDLAFWRDLDDTLRGYCDEIGRDSDEITRSIHWPLGGDDDPQRLAADVQPFFEAGVDLVIYSMRGPYDVALVEALASAIERVN